jgi:hypothetical protein
MANVVDVDRQSRQVWLMLVIFGVLLAVVGWLSWIF